MGQYDTRDLDAVKDRIDELKTEKGQLSRKIGEAKRSGADPDELISRLKVVSDESKALQKLLKKSLNSGAGAQKQSEPEVLGLPSPVLPAGDGVVTEVLSDVRGPELEAEWDAFVRAHPAGSAFHLMHIRRFIESTYGHLTHYLCARDKTGAILGVLPLVQLKSRLFGNFTVSVPYFNYGGVLAYGEDTAARLVAEARTWSEAVGARHVELRHMAESGLDLPQRKDKVIFWLPLPEDSETLWKGFRPKIRAQVKRARRESPEVQIGGIELLDDFYDVFAHNMRRLGTPVYGKSFFANLLREFADSAWLVIVRVNGRAAGCAFLLGYEDRMEIPWASTLQELNSTGINMLMYWEALCLAISKGYTVFDFGRCSDKAGTYWFKQQWGARPMPLHWEYCLPEGGELPQLNPNNPKFRLLIAVWRRLPLWLTRLLGPLIVRSLP